MNLSRLVLLFSFLPPRDNNAIPVDLRRVESARSIRIRLWKRDWTGIIFTCVYRSARTYSTRATERTVRARASKSNASANDTGASRSFLRSYVDLAAASVSLPFDRPSLSPSLSLPFSPTPLSSSLALNHTCPPSLSPFLTFTFLSPSHCIDPPPPVSPSLFLRSTLLCPLQACYALFLSFELNDLFSYLFPLFPLISFVYSFPLSLSLLFSRYISSSQLSSCPCSPPYTSLDRSLSLSLSPSISFHVLRYISVPHFHYRSSRLCPYDPPNPHHSSFLPSNFPHPPLYRCIPLLALRLLPATHSPPSLSLTHTLSLSVSLYRTVSPVYASPTLSPFLTLFLSLSPSCFEHRRSTFFLAVCPPSPSRVHPIWDSPKRARGGSAHHRLIHDYYHLICPAALFIVRAGEIAGQRRILSLETFWPGDLEQIGSRISADSGSGRRAR